MRLATVSIVIGRLLHRMRLDRRIKERETKSLDNFDAINQEFLNRGKSEPATNAATLLDTKMNQEALYSFLGQYPSLAANFNRDWPVLARNNSRPSRWEASLMFNEIGVKLAQKGDFYAAITSVACSSLFVKDSPLMWAAQAEIYLAWEDRIAAKWAEKVLGFNEAEGTSIDVRKHLSGNEGRGLLYAKSQRALEIMSICSQQKEWRDSYELKKACGAIDF